MHLKYNKWQIKNLLLSETIDFNNFNKATLIDFLEQSRTDTQEYKARVEKAIEYLEYCWKPFVYGIEYRTLIEILKGEVNGNEDKNNIKG